MWANVWLSDPHLIQCKWDAKGLLTDLMCIAHHGTPRGSITNGGLALSVQDIAKTCSESVRKTTRLMQLLFKLNRIGQNSDGIWYIPSMIRETEQSEQAAKDGLKGWHAKQQKTLYPTLTPTLTPDVEVEADKDVEEKRDNPDAPPAPDGPGTSGREQRPQKIDDLHEQEKQKYRKQTENEPAPETVEAPETDDAGMGLV